MMISKGVQIIEESQIAYYSEAQAVGIYQGCTDQGTYTAIYSTTPYIASRFHPFRQMEHVPRTAGVGNAYMKQ